MNYPSVGIGILNWNGRSFLSQYLPFLYQLTYPNVTVYVIDNDSSDDSLAYLRSEHPRVRIIDTGGNYGVAGGYNKGFAQMHEDYLLMLNSDVEVTPGLLEPMVALMQANESIAAVQPKILADDNREYYEHAGAAGGMIDVLGYPFCRGRLFDHVEKDNELYAQQTEIFWASGACALYRNKAFQKVNGFYDYFFMHSEEIDLCWRMIAAGYKIQYCPAVQVYHKGGGSLDYNSPKKTYLNFRNNMIMCCRNSTLMVNCWLVPVRTLLDLTAAIKFYSDRQPEHGRAVFKAYRDFYKWLIRKKTTNTLKRSLVNIPVVFKKLLVVEYYLKMRKTYRDILT